MSSLSLDQETSNVLKELLRVIVDFLSVWDPIPIHMTSTGCLDIDTKMIWFLRLDVLLYQVFLDLLKNGQSWKILEFFHSSSIASPPIPTASWYGEYISMSSSLPFTFLLLKLVPSHQDIEQNQRRQILLPSSTWSPHHLPTLISLMMVMNISGIPHSEFLQTVPVSNMWVISNTLSIFSNFVFRWISEFFTKPFPKCKAAFIDITLSRSICWPCKILLRTSHQLETFSISVK